MLLVVLCVFWWGLFIGSANAEEALPEAIHAEPVYAASPHYSASPTSSTRLDQTAQDCWSIAARQFGVNVQVLRAIAEVESGFRATAINRNRNGTADIGIMQINSSWLPTLARYGVVRADLFDPCTNIHVGAWILSENNRRFGATSWRAVGAYNARTDAKRLAYAIKVHRRLRNAQ